MEKSRFVEIMMEEGVQPVFALIAWDYWEKHHSTDIRPPVEEQTLRITCRDWKADRTAEREDQSADPIPLEHDETDESEDLNEQAQIFWGRYIMEASGKHLRINEL